jgi:UDP-glucuronate 4-epimerase
VDKAAWRQKIKILVTGIAGFIGYHLAKRLEKQGELVVGIDNINDYYDVGLKYARLNNLGFKIGKGFNEQENSGTLQSCLSQNLFFKHIDLNNAVEIKDLMKKEKFDVVVNLAAQAGVRYSLTNPDTYISSNVQGFLNLLEAMRFNPVKHFVYASSSSVYGLNNKQPFSEKDPVNSPASLYAVSKRTNELMAFSYSHLYGIPVTGLRFFTVYGPWGRPDMALFLFTKAILSNQPIDVFNNGEMQRDFTYVDDIVEGIVRIIYKTPAEPKVYNIGNGSPVKLLDFVHALEDELGVKAKINMMPMQPGDVVATWADCSELRKDTGYQPSTDARKGIKEFVVWYREYYKL